MLDFRYTCPSGQLPPATDAPDDERMAFNKNDLKTFYRMGFLQGLAFSGSETPTVREIEGERFSPAYREWYQSEYKNRRNTLLAVHRAWVAAGCPKEGIVLDGIPYTPLDLEPGEWASIFQTRGEE